MIIKYKNFYKIGSALILSVLASQSHAGFLSFAIGYGVATSNNKSNEVKELIEIKPIVSKSHEIFLSTCLLKFENKESIVIINAAKIKSIDEDGIIVMKNGDPISPILEKNGKFSKNKDLAKEMIIKEMQRIEEKNICFKEEDKIAYIIHHDKKIPVNDINFIYLFDEDKNIINSDKNRATLYFSLPNNSSFKERRHIVNGLESILTFGQGKKKIDEIWSQAQVLQVTGEESSHIKVLSQKYKNK